MRIDGGGYVTGIVSHSDGTTYARSDISGFYKRNADGSWTEMLDFLRPSEKNLMGVAGIAIAPQDSKTVYAAAGQASADKNTGEWVNGDVLKTTDGGETWERTGLSKPFGSLEGGRTNGEPIAVSPYDENVVYVLTKRDGLWKTEDGADSWQKVDGLSLSSETSTGFVEFSNASENIIYVNVSGEGMYESTDGGKTYSLTANSPDNLRRVAQQRDGTLICSANDGIYRYKNSTWECVYNNLTYSGSALGIGGIDTDPYNDSHVIAITSTGADGITGLGNNHILESYDGGTTFTDRYDDHDNAANNNFVNTSIFADKFTASSSIVFDGARDGVVYISDWFGIYELKDITQTPIPVYRNSKGIEDTVCYNVKAMTGKYSVMAGFADIDAVGWKTVYSMAKKMQDTKNGRLQDTTEIDYCETYPDYIARVGACHASGGVKAVGFEYTSDGGITWTFRELSADLFGSDAAPHIAVSSGLNTNGNPTILVSGKDGIYYSEDMGETWNKSNGAPSVYNRLWIYDTPMAADRVLGDTFYVCTGGIMYVSGDGGKNFTVYNKNVPDSDKSAQLETSPYAKGNLIITTGRGIYFSNNYGKTFTKIDELRTPVKASFGKGDGTPRIYAFDSSDEKCGLYFTEDFGETWRRMNAEGNNFSGITDLDADKNEIGLVYIGTVNRGVFCIRQK